DCLLRRTARACSEPKVVPQPHVNCGSRRVSVVEVDALVSGAEGDRTPDLERATLALSQLSYRPRRGRSVAPNSYAAAQFTPTSWLSRVFEVVASASFWFVVSIENSVRDGPDAATGKPLSAVVPAWKDSVRWRLQPTPAAAAAASARPASGCS